MWKSKFSKKTHCPAFKANKLRNPITNRPIKNGSVIQRWFAEACKKGGKADIPARKKYGMRERIHNVSDLLRLRYKKGGIGGMIDLIESYNRGQFLPDLQRAFKKAFVAADREEVPEVVFQLGGRQFKVSKFGPMAKRLQEISGGYRIGEGSDIPEARKKNFCKARNVTELPERPSFEPQVHQIRPVEFMRRENARLLLEYGLGSGKTCASSMVVDDYLRNNPGNLVYFFSPGSLRSNFVKEYCSFCPQDRREMSRDQAYRFMRFFSTDDGTLKRKIPKVFKDCLVVVDEAQSLIESVRQGDVPQTDDLMKNLAVLFQRLTRGSYENVRLLLLSGTPMPDTLEQHYNCLTLLKPETMREIEYPEFVDMFDEGEYYIPKDEGAVKSLYSDCIYYFVSPQTEVPRVRYEKEVVEVDPSSGLGAAIWEAINNENMIRRIPLEALIRSYVKRGMGVAKAKQMAILSKTRAARRDTSRRLSNLYLGGGGEDPEDARGSARMQREVTPENVEQYSPKLHLLLQNLTNREKCPGKQIIYCPFKETAGVKLISQLLSAAGISNVVYSGDVGMTKRDEILREYNDETNDLGQKLRVFIYTDAAAEGITLLNVRGIHLINEDVYSSHMKQVIGRGVRYRSHIRLPEQDRNVVVFRYRVKVEDMSPDQMNYDQGVKREELLTLIQERIHGEWSMKF